MRDGDKQEKDKRGSYSSGHVTDLSASPGGLVLPRESVEEAQAKIFTWSQYSPPLLLSLPKEGCVVGGGKWAMQRPTRHKECQPQLSQAAVWLRCLH